MDKIKIKINRANVRKSLIIYQRGKGGKGDLSLLQFMSKVILYIKYILCTCSHFL